MEVLFFPHVVCRAERSEDQHLGEHHNHNTLRWGSEAMEYFVCVCLQNTSSCSQLPALNSLSFPYSFLEHSLSMNAYSQHSPVLYSHSPHSNQPTNQPTTGLYWPALSCSTGCISIYLGCMDSGCLIINPFMHFIMSWYIHAIFRLKLSWCWKCSNLKRAEIKIEATHTAGWSTLTLDMFGDLIRIFSTIRGAGDVWH